MSDTPVEPVVCGCGRSATGFCTGLHAISNEDWDRMLLEGVAPDDNQKDNTQ